MQANQLKEKRHARRKAGIRKRIMGTSQRPRLTVYRSLKHFHAQLIDDVAGKTLVAASSLGIEGSTGNKDAAEKVGADLAAKAIAAGVTEVALDRNGFKYHGRIKSFADAARKAGLKF